MKTFFFVHYPSFLRSNKKTKPKKDQIQPLRNLSDESLESSRTRINYQNNHQLSNSEKFKSSSRRRSSIAAIKEILKLSDFDSYSSDSEIENRNPNSMISGSNHRSKMNQNSGQKKTISSTYNNKKLIQSGGSSKNKKSSSSRSSKTAQRSENF